MLGLLGAVRPWWPRLSLGRSRQAGLDIVGHILFVHLGRPGGDLCQADRSIFSRRAEGGGRRVTVTLSGILEIAC